MTTENLNINANDLPAIADTAKLTRLVTELNSEAMLVIQGGDNGEGKKSELYDRANRNVRH